MSQTLRIIRATRAVAPPRTSVPAHMITVSRLVERAVEQGAMRPVPAVMSDPRRYAEWARRALVLVSHEEGITSAQHQELIDDCDAHAGLTPEKIAETITTMLGLALLCAVAAPIFA